MVRHNDKRAKIKAGIVIGEVIPRLCHNFTNFRQLHAAGLDPPLRRWTLEE